MRVYYLFFNNNLWKVWLKNREVVNYTRWRHNCDWGNLTKNERAKHQEFIKATGWDFITI